MSKRSAALLSVFSNTFLVFLKGTVGFVTGSMSILSEALNSATDVVASLLAFFSVREAEKPADTEHPYGHGKYENLSGLVEALLITAAAGVVFYEAAVRLIEGTGLRVPFVGVAVMGVSMLVKFLVSSRLHRVSEETDSIALEAEAKNLRMDVWTNFAVLSGLVLITVTKLNFIDSLLAFFVAGMVVKEGVSIFRKALQGLVDRSLPDEDIEIIHSVLHQHKDMIKDYHELRTRRAGSERHIDLHLTVCRNEKISDTHSTMDSIERELSRRLPNLKIVIHPEPCGHGSENCPDECYWLRGRKKSPQQ
ncbi:MAG: cation transporter [Nitrospirae bacterium]|nr:MAG: cation transporter [Nitrospirota bacterium]